MKLKTELTMKKYINLNISLFILWTIILGFIFIWGGSGNATSDDIIYLNFGLVIIYSFKSFANYLEFKKIHNSIILIITNILIIYSMQNIYLSNAVYLLLILVILFSQTFINLIFIKEVRKKCIKIFIIFSITMLLTVILNYVINSEGLSFIVNMILIIILVLVLFYQKMLEHKYVRYITENIDIAKEISNIGVFIYGNLINFILIIIALFSLSANRSNEEYLIILFSLLIIIIAKFIKKYVKNKITNQTKKFSKVEIVLFAIFAFLMILKVVPYELKSFIIPIIYIYLDIKLSKITWENTTFKFKLLIIAISIVVISIFIILIDFAIFIIYLLMHIIPILILIEKIKEFKEIKEVETINEEDIY